MLWRRKARADFMLLTFLQFTHTHVVGRSCNNGKSWLVESNRFLHLTVDDRYLHRPTRAGWTCCKEMQLYNQMIWRQEPTTLHAIQVAMWIHSPGTMPSENILNSQGILIQSPGLETRSLLMLSVPHSHPVAAFFFLAFRLGALLMYLLGSIFTDNFTLVFVVTILLLAFDFWTVKNVSGRLLVGLRWWNEIQEDGSNRWVFESAHVSKRHKRSVGIRKLRAALPSIAQSKEQCCGFPTVLDSSVCDSCIVGVASLDSCIYIQDLMASYRRGGYRTECSQCVWIHAMW